MQTETNIFIEFELNSLETWRLFSSVSSMFSSAAWQTILLRQSDITVNRLSSDLERSVKNVNEATEGTIRKSNGNQHRVFKSRATVVSNWSKQIYSCRKYTEQDWVRHEMRHYPLQFMVVTFLECERTVGC